MAAASANFGTLVLAGLAGRARPLGEGEALELPVSGLDVLDIVLEELHGLEVGDVAHLERVRARRVEGALDLAVHHVHVCLEHPHALVR